MIENGKICYLQIPAADIQQSSDFYSKVFGWKLRHRDDGSIAFDDRENGVSGTWILNRPPLDKPGILIYIMVDSIPETIDKITANGGRIVQQRDDKNPVDIALFSDPAGNVLGLYSH